MKVTKAQNVSAYSVQNRNQISFGEKSLPAREKRIDKYTSVPAAYASAQNTTQTVEQVADALRKQYPWVNFTFAQLGDRPEDIAQFVASAGKGVHLVIDPDVLEWMAQGEKAWSQGLEMIGKALHDVMLPTARGEHNKGAVIADDGEITLWSAKWEKPNADMEKEFEHMKTILKHMDEARKNQEEQLKKLKMEQKKKLNYQMGKDMARLAKGVTDRDVRSLISKLYANRQKIATSSSYNKKEVQAALAQIDHVIGRARAKIRHLRDEEDMLSRVKKAEKQQEQKRKLQLEQELKARRRNRKAKEHAAIYEKFPDMPGLRDEEERREAVAEATLSQIASGFAVPQVGMQPAPAPAPGEGAGTSVSVSTPSGGTVEVTITPMV